MRLMSCICAGWLLVAALLAQLSCLAANHRLLVASVQPVGETPPQLHHVIGQPHWQTVARHVRRPWLELGVTSVCFQPARLAFRTDG
jgi:hypothetical protein